MSNVLKVKANDSGRMFFLSDIHGELPTLLAALKSLKFDSKVDNLVCAGDLVDRGEYSRQTADWFVDKHFSKENIHSVLGNHDVFTFDDKMEDCWMMNGGIKTLREFTTYDERIAWGERISELPYAIEVEWQGGLFGVVHAGVPESFNSWLEFYERLDAGNTALEQECVWMRDYVEYKEYVDYQKPLVGIDMLIHGHTPVKEPMLVGNRLHIDTGLVYGKHLSIVELVPVQDELKVKVHKFDLVK